jgi:hypothetical protein
MRVTYRDEHTTGEHQSHPTSLKPSWCDRKALVEGTHFDQQNNGRADTRYLS